MFLHPSVSHFVYGSQGRAMMSLSPVMDSTTRQSRPPPPAMMAPHPRMGTPRMAPVPPRMASPGGHLARKAPPPPGRTLPSMAPLRTDPLWSTSGRYPSYWNAFLFKSELCSPLIVDFTLPKSEKHKIARIIFFSSTLHFTLFTFTKI